MTEKISNREEVKAALQRMAALEINTGDVDGTIEAALDIISRAWEHGHTAFGGEPNPYAEYSLAACVCGGPPGAEWPTCNNECGKRALLRMSQ